MSYEFNEIKFSNEEEGFITMDGFASQFEIGSSLKVYAFTEGEVESVCGCVLE